MSSRESRAVSRGSARRRRRSNDKDPPNMSDLRIVLLGKSVSENSRVGNFILGRAAFDSEAPSDVVERVGGRLKDRRVMVINSPQLLNTHISVHQITQTVRECVSLSDPGPHAFILVLQYKDFTEEDMKRVKRVLEKFSEEAIKHTIVITTDEEKLRAKGASVKADEFIQQLTEECGGGHLQLDHEIQTQFSGILQQLEKILRENSEDFLTCKPCHDDEETQGEDLSRTFASLRTDGGVRATRQQKMNVVLCGSDETLKNLVSKLLSEKKDVDLHGHVISVLELPALFNTRLSEEEVMRQTLRCVSLCHPGVHVFLLIIPDSPNNEDKAEMEEIQRIFSLRINKHMMILIMQNSEHQTEELNEETQSVIERFGGRHHFFGPTTRVSTLMENIEQMLEENRGEFFSTETFLEAQMKKLMKFEEMEKKIHKLETHLQSQGSRENPDDLRIVLLGKTGVGKSAAGNTILGRNAFTAETSHRSVTKESQRETSDINGRHVTVIDTPGLFDTELTNEEIQREIRHCISMILPGPHVFIIVLNSGQRFTREEATSVKIIQETFGEKSLMFTMVLFTRGDDLKDKTIEQYLEEPGSPLMNLIEACENRYHVFNNNQPGDRTQVSDLLEKIDHMVNANGGSFYSCKMFREMEREQQEQQMKILMDRVRETEELMKKLEEEKERMKMMMEEERQKHDEERKRREEELKREIRELEEHQREIRDEMRRERETFKHEIEEIRREKEKIKREKDQLQIEIDKLMKTIENERQNHETERKKREEFNEREDQFKREMKEKEELMKKYEGEKERIKMMMEEERQNHDEEKKRREELKREIREQEKHQREIRDEMRRERETFKHEIEEIRQEKENVKKEKENLQIRYDTEIDRMMNRIENERENHKKERKRREEDFNARVEQYKTLMKEKEESEEKMREEMKREREEWEKQKLEEKTKRREEEDEKRREKEQRVCDEFNERLKEEKERMEREKEDLQSKHEQEENKFREREERYKTVIKEREEKESKMLEQMKLERLQWEKQTQDLTRKIEEEKKKDKQKSEHHKKQSPVPDHTKRAECESDDHECLRIVLIGRTGNGKSATGNTILGRDEFVSELCSDSVTTVCEKGVGEVDGRSVAVVDTPGLFDTTLTNDQVVEEIEKCISLSSPGPHVFIIVVSLGRFIQVEAETVDLIKKIFGHKSAQFSIVLFTRGDELMGTSIEDYVKRSRSGELKKLIRDCGNRFLVFNNREKQDKTQVTRLLNMIEEVKNTNEGRYFTNSMFEEAEMSIKKRFDEIMKEREMENRREELQAKYEMDMKIMMKRLEEEKQRADEERKKMENQIREKEQKLRREFEEKEKTEQKKRETENQTRSEEEKQRRAEYHQRVEEMMREIKYQRLQYEKQQKEREEEDRKREEKYRQNQEKMKNEQERIITELQMKQEEEIKKRESDEKKRNEEEEEERQRWERIIKEAENDRKDTQEDIKRQQREWEDEKKRQMREREEEKRKRKVKHEEQLREKQEELEKMRKRFEREREEERQKIEEEREKQRREREEKEREYEENKTKMKRHYEQLERERKEEWERKKLDDDERREEERKRWKKMVEDLKQEQEKEKKGRDEEEKKRKEREENERDEMKKKHVEEIKVMKKKHEDEARKQAEELNDFRERNEQHVLELKEMLEERQKQYEILEKLYQHLQVQKGEEIKELLQEVEKQRNKGSCVIL